MTCRGRVPALGQAARCALPGSRRSTGSGCAAGGKGHWAAGPTPGSDRLVKGPGGCVLVVGMSQHEKAGRQARVPMNTDDTTAGAGPARAGAFPR